ncbi:PQQ-binding-like beta-propeller repeat protein [Cryptosporangium sp. NPDC048952]|uniref:outer membrane protein assembly factor BamB family protein n=1 Tax=Cryptosporangium sp. NPDC048952 TaxID=3363961 RepID=UPI0037182C5C
MGRVYLGYSSAGRRVVSGVVQWRVRLTAESQGAYGRPVATGGRAFLSDRDALHTLDSRTGAKGWSILVGEGIAESDSPQILGNRGYLSAVDGTLYATKGTYRERAVVAGGLFHFADNDGVVSLERPPARRCGSALYLTVFRGGPALCSVELPSR